ncbi:DUF1579 family protein [Phytohabitans suffuscus]|uniref:Uncharacterized protein n=1 Tax=Phytohabitans suffuscus TaxID=624315 RepID=A0A6F8YF05_9ACTN|nr:DUF1579 family protein [Phytohabitans suffuscus]BCB84558.1 hypothetical protein Psuf_018710 [Phytohabitans suffuscus]
MTSDDKIGVYLEEHPVEARPVLERPEPSPRMRDLDFLIGTVDSVFDTGVRFECTSEPIMDGLYIRMEMRATYADGTWRNNGTWIIAWSEIEQEFQSYYWDALGNHGTSTSPGWRDGVLEFVGSHVLAEPGTRGMTMDRYSRFDEEHFMLEAFVQVDGEWKKWNTQDCHRRPRLPDPAG